MVSVGDADLRSMDGGRGGYNTNLEDTLQTELEFLLQARRSRQISDREKELNIHRYGSAPPTVEGSLSAVGGLFGSSNIRDSNCWTNSDNHAIACEDDIRSHPAYLSYYYSRGSVNPRLPPPALSKEDWRVTQRFQVGGGSSIGDLRDLRKNMLVADGNGSSLFSMQPGGPRLSVEKAEDDLMDLRMANRQASTEWLGRGFDQMSGLPSPGLGARRKSFADILQDGPNQYAPLLDQPSRPQSHNSLADMVGRMSTSDSHAVGLYSGRIESMEPHLSGASTSNLPRIPSRNTSDSHSLASFGSSLSRNRTPEPQLIGGLPGNGFPLVDSRVLPTERKNAIGSNIRNGCTLGVTVLDDVAASLSGLSLSDMRCANQNSFQQHHLPMDRDSQLDFSSTVLNGSNHSMQQLIESNASKFAGSSKLIDSARKNGYTAQMGAFESSAFDKVAIPTHGVDQVNFPKRTSSSANLYSKMASSAFESLEGSDDHYYQCGKVPTNFSSHLHGGLSGERKLNSAFDNYRAGSAYTGHEDGEFLQRSAFENGNDISPALLDPAYVQYLQNNSDQATQAAAGTRNPSHVRDRYGSSAGDLEDLRKAYLEALLAQQKQHYGLPLGKPAASNHRNQGNLKYGHLQYPGNTKANSGIPSVGYDNLMMQDERIARFTSMMRSSSEASISPWSSGSTFNVEGKITSSLLDEFKNNKIRSFELSDISGHIVEFSSDQYGSRFIQQKLETATEEEKNKIFPEIMPHARTLMTDVFGNYVIQKFFEHGTEIQRKELASQLTGHVLPLSLQMYGCRVIQKALEAVDVEQQTQMVAELDGSIMKCVRDQNGNHVIQKCIECVPQNQIQFIISSFYGQVVALSMHPYGCRVIQRVLEYCDDPSTQEVIMDEIMQSVITLAQDQYGNYVIQHVLEHGKSHERSAIVNKLAGQIVRMSQQKFASNVIEKCLTFGSPEERQILIQEIIGFTDENEPLQAMMRDPFGNYVVQKVLETCDDRSLEFILSRIKVHLNTLKRYTYGKHIVSRVEKLITTGERRIGMSSAISSGVM